MIRTSVFVLLSATVVLSGCATVKVPQATGGSRADATIEMSYEYGMFEKPVVKWEKADKVAQQKCEAWGYSDAERFSGGTRECQAFNGYGNCVRWFVTTTYQCVDDSDTGS